MPFEVTEVSESDFPELVECMWESYEKPPQHLYSLFCPINGSDPNARADALKESTERLWDWHVSDPASYWHRVIDTRSKKTVGAALWKIHKTNPYEHPEHHEVYWHPEGGQREFATKALGQFEEPKERLATRPHLYLNIIFTHPDYQRQGVADLMLKWGIAKAAELDIEMWLDAWVFGVPVYKRYGFVVVEVNSIKPITESPDDAWLECERKWTDLTTWVMWRPRDGPYVEGESVRPWETS